MSAAPPLPPLPPPPPTSPGANGNTYGGLDSVGNHARSYSMVGSAGSHGNGEKPYLHIDALKAKALEGYDINNSIRSLLKAADVSLKQSQSLLSFRRPDLAYVEYLRATEIIVTVIPRHANHFEFTHDTDAESKYKTLLRQVNQEGDRFMRIKEIIMNNNKRTGVLPEGGEGGPRLNGGSVRHAQARTIQTDGRRDGVVYMPTPERWPVNGLDGEDGPRPGSAGRVRPTPSPKPQALHGNAILHPTAVTNSTLSSAGVDALTNRFAKLRMIPGSINTSNTEGRDSRTSLTSSITSSSVTMPDASDYSGRNSFDHALAQVSSAPQPGIRPNGPRGMPNGPPRPLDTHFAAAMPKAPSPTYSPARNMQTTGSINPPRHSARSIVGTVGRQNYVQSNAYYHAPNGTADSSGYFTSQPPDINGNESYPGPSPRRKSVHLPKETRVAAERLYDYLKMYNMLLIDMRSRADFDEGHIFCQNVICIEPTILRENMSADELGERLVLSPQNEQDLFQQRHIYDLVVYYDRDTQSEQFLSRPSGERDQALRWLYDALYEFNQDKPLQRPPILLMGGVSAWSDLVGNQALVSSTTATKAKTGRPISRVPIAGSQSRIHAPRRRLRDYNPLDAEEERSWMERARTESVVVGAKPPLDEEDESAQVDGESAEGRRAIEEFLERFPEAGSLDKEVTVQPTSRPPPQPPKIPLYPSAPPPSQYSAEPARPAPAAPRMSYSGVNERAVSDPRPPRGSSQLAPYIPPKYLAQNVRLPRTGLVNFGVTCYMNATLQALSATTPLSVFFLDSNKFRDLVQRDNWKGSKGVLPELYANLVRGLWKGDVEAIKPSSFRGFCGRLNREWCIDRQQDAKEFFDFLVDCLHEDLNGMWSRTPLRALTDQEEAQRERMPKLVVSKLEWGRYTHREQSFITSLFGGQHASRLRCTTCGFTSTTYEAFYSISVEIPRSSQSTLQNCLRSYCAEEMLSGDEVWKCPSCKREREATKQITITRAPQFLMVHFKRFSASKTESARKVRTPISFPLYELDLEPYMLPSPSPTEAQAIARDYGSQELKTDANTTAPYIYDAYAVIRHIGTTLSSGHYTCAVKDRARRCWRMFNDTKVQDFQPEELGNRYGLGNEEAYMVAYQRTPAEK